MTTSRSALPCTSTPSQKLAVPSNTRIAVLAEFAQQLLARRLALHQQTIRPRAAPFSSARAAARARSSARYDW